MGMNTPISPSTLLKKGRLAKIQSSFLNSVHWLKPCEVVHINQGSIQSQNGRNYMNETRPERITETSYPSRGYSRSLMRKPFLFCSSHVSFHNMPESSLHVCTRGSWWSDSRCFTALNGGIRHRWSYLLGFSLASRWIPRARLVFIRDLLRWGKYLFFCERYSGSRRLISNFSSSVARTGRLDSFTK